MFLEINLPAEPEPRTLLARGISQQRHMARLPFAFFWSRSLLLRGGWGWRRGTRDTCMCGRRPRPQLRGKESATTTRRPLYFSTPYSFSTQSG